MTLDDMLADAEVRLDRELDLADGEPSQLGLRLLHRVDMLVDLLALRLPPSCWMGCT